MPTSDSPHYDALPVYSSSTASPVFAPPPRKSIISPYSFILLLLFFIRLVFAVFSSTSPMVGLLFVVIALAPTAVFAFFILRIFHDPAVPMRFLLSQFLTAAIPLILLILPFELIFAIISISPLLAFVDHDKLEDLEDLIENSANTGLEEAQDVDDQLLEKLFSLFPLPAIIVVALLVAFLSAGLVEEVGKWFVSRRYKDVDADALLHNTRRISARGIFACACISGLGFATMENIGYSMSELSDLKQQVPLAALLGLARGFIAYALHIATQLYVAVAAARKYLFGDRGSVSIALLHAVIVHGAFDGVAFVVLVLAALKKVPSWILFVVPVFDVAVVVLFGMLVRARYLALLQREHAVQSPAPSLDPDMPLV